MDEETLSLAAQIPLKRAQEWAEPLTAAMDQYGITKPRQQAAFIAQTGYESMWFQRCDENLNYSTPERIRAVWPYKFKSLDSARAFIRKPEALANYVYANRIGNGDEYSGDGWRYRGRGLIQLTGKDNYREAQIGMGIPLLATPDLLKRPEFAAASAAWWWTDRNLNKLADVDDIDAISGYINRGDPDKIAHGADERREAYFHALSVLEGEG